jgi:HEAT repeat protein
VVEPDYLQLQLGSEAKAAVPSLILALNDQDPLVRISAACALSSIQPQDERVIAALIPLLEDDSPIVRRTILRIIRALYSAVSAAVPEALTERHAGVQPEASKVLEKTEGSR